MIIKKRGKTMNLFSFHNKMLMSTQASLVLKSLKFKSVIEFLE